VDSPDVELDARNGSGNHPPHLDVARNLGEHEMISEILKRLGWGLTVLWLIIWAVLSAFSENGARVFIFLGLIPGLPFLGLCYLLAWILAPLRSRNSK
jgi:hypothetical protein